VASVASPAAGRPRTMTTVSTSAQGIMYASQSTNQTEEKAERRVASPSLPSDNL
jgi:hypothetical protein